MFSCLMILLYKQHCYTPQPCNSLEEISTRLLYSQQNHYCPHQHSQNLPWKQGYQGLHLLLVSIFPNSYSECVFMQSFLLSSYKNMSSSVLSLNQASQIDLLFKNM